ncbi:uncharacterized protein LOC121385903 [Gigantopelta aegis]|uniref:uncharacterized protein LOC121385903 n=1 Tax=Gigantopelta aegis TaxID=1735272 RepID=UPI001B88AB74|nr:uncharacterized protein LOC121385903 [Gigantopelta aegis]
MSCEVTGGNPPVSTIIFTCGEIPTKTSQSTVGPAVVRDIRFTVKRADDNQICRCSAIHTTNQYNLFKETRISVIYSPNVTVYSKYNIHYNSVKIICEANGRPPEYHFSKFTHFWGGQKIREIAGRLESPNRHVHIIQPYSYKDSGTYECTVSNNVTGLNNVTEQTGNKTINMHVRLVLMDTSKQNETIAVTIGQNLTLSKTIFSKNNISSYNWINPHGATTKHNSEVNSVDVTLNIYKTRVRDTGYRFSLLIGRIEEDDHGLHVLTVCNAFGCGEFYTNVVTAEPSKENTTVLPEPRKENTTMLPEPSRENTTLLPGLKLICS